MPDDRTEDLPIIDELLPYADRLEPRDPRAIDLIVLHCTELPDLAEARAMGERVLYEGSGTGASGHYYIDRNGTCFRYVGDDRIAHHVVGHNQRSIGIELVNKGRYPNWFHAGGQAMTEPYDERQIEGLIALIRQLCRAHPSIAKIAAHADLDRRTIAAEDNPKIQIRRRLDPGPQFPWSVVLKAVRLERIEAEADGKKA